MPNESMTSRERWLAVLGGRKPDRIPMDYAATPEVTDRLLRELGCSSQTQLWRRLHIDRPVHLQPRYVGPQLPKGHDVFGIERRSVSYADGAGVYDEPASHPLGSCETIGQIEQEYTWPEPDWWDYSEIPAQLQGHGQDIIRGGGSEPFLVYCQLRGLERAFVDLIDKPDIVHYCLDKLFALAYEETRRIIEQANGEVHLVNVSEDMGSQESLLFSPNQIEEFLLPRMKRMIDLAHSAGAFVFHHSDGAIRTILPRMIELGIDILNPIQWRCKGMDRDELKRDFGDKLVFHGGVDNQTTMPFGTVDDVRDEVIYNIKVLGDGGGYVLAPCHNIQPTTPTQNIIALYDTGYEEGTVC